MWLILVPAVRVYLWKLSDYRCDLSLFACSVWRTFAPCDACAVQCRRVRVPYVDHVRAAFIIRAGMQAGRQAGRQAGQSHKPAFVRNWVGLVSALKHGLLYSCRFSICESGFRILSFSTKDACRPCNGCAAEVTSILYFPPCKNVCDWLDHSVSRCAQKCTYVTHVHCPRNHMTVSTGQMGDHVSLLGAVALEVC